MSYKDRLAVCGLVTLERRRLLSDLILFYKIVNKLIDTDLINSLSLAPSTTRGHPFKVVYNGARINSRLHFFSIRTTKIWNSLPSNIACAQSVDSFRKGISTIAFNKFLII